MCVCGHVMRYMRRNRIDMMALYSQLDLSIRFGNVLVMAQMCKPGFFPEILDYTSRIGRIAKYAPGERTIAPYYIYIRPVK